MVQVGLRDYLLAGLAIWVVLLSIFLARAIAHYRSLAKGENIKDLGKILERLASKQDFQQRQIAQIEEKLAGFYNLSLSHFTKHALIRFNPFEETGGDQSFVVALLDSKNNGIVFSSLHSRSGTRVYAKEIVGAKPTNHKFSKEEKEAVEKAARPTPSGTGPNALKA